MTSPLTYTLQAIPQRIGVEHSLGRHVQHDPRSRAFAFAPRQGGGLHTVQHVRRVPVFNQGTTGSCTGQAMAGCLGTGPVANSLPTTATIDEMLALKLYSLATAMDSFPGTYPPNDTGSTGLASAKAARQLGYLSGWTQAFGFDATLAALMNGPVSVGVNWYDSFDAPDANGIVSLPASAKVIGGHQFVCDGVDVQKELVWATNSWSSAWGKQGRFALPFEVLRRLLAEQGDVTVPVPVTAPAPKPVPIDVGDTGHVVSPVPLTPTPATPVSPASNAADAELAAAFGSFTAAVTRWKGKKNLG